MRTEREIFDAASRAKVFLDFLMSVTKYNGISPSPNEVVGWYHDMVAEPETVAIESGRMMLSRGEEGSGYFDLYINVTP